MKNNILYNNVLDNIIYREQNQYLKNKLKKIKSSIYTNNPKNFNFIKDNNKLNLNIKTSKKLN